jgi:hypothetical protein
LRKKTMKLDAALEVKRRNNTWVLCFSISLM